MADDRALTLAAVALHDAECSDRHCSGPALGAFYEQARIALGAAAEAIRAPIESKLRDSYQAIHDLHADREHDEQRIAELEQHVAVLEVRHSEADELVRAGERERWLAAVECPSPCDDDCELRPDGCHEEHDVPSHRAHNPFQCSEIRLAIAAAVAAERERLHIAVLAMRDQADDLSSSPAASIEVAEDEAAESHAYDSVLELLGEGRD